MGHAVAQVPTSARPELPGSRQASLPEDPSTSGRTPNIAQNLPFLVLHRIFSHLPSCSLAQCARVCRHWHTCLPEFKFRVVWWLQENGPRSYLTISHLGRGFSSRTQPFLQAEKSPFLHPLTRLEQQHQQQQQENKPAAPRQDTQQQPPAAGDLLSWLAHAAVNHHLRQTPELRLRPAPLDWSDEAVAGAGDFAFSPCSRWLALACAPQQESFSYLRLYGWENDAWQRCLLASDVTEPVTLFKFSPMPPCNLVSVHGVQVLAWSKEPDSLTWHSSLVSSFPQSHQVLDCYPMANGDHIIMLQRAGNTRTQLHVMFYRRTGESQSWESVARTTYGTEWDSWLSVAWTVEPQSCQLALRTTAQDPDTGYLTNELHIWHTGLNSLRPEPWACLKSVIPWQHTRVERIIYSPDGQHLLGILSEKQACLWTVDPQRRIRIQLIIPHCLYNPVYKLRVQASFRSDGKQLALARSLRQVQLFYCDAKGHWYPGTQLDAPAARNVPADDFLKDLRLSSSGRTLVRRTHWQLDIWHQDPGAGWQHLVQHSRQENQRGGPQYCLLQPGELVCTTIEDPEMLLRVYGPDSRGRLVQKVCMPVGQSIQNPDAASPDGMSLLLGSTRHPTLPLQLVSAKKSESCLFF